MKQPSVLLTLLEPNEGLARTLGQELTRMGAQVQAHVWHDDPGKLGFAEVIPEVAKDSCSAWVIAGEVKSLRTQSIRQGLSLVALAAQQAHGHRLPVFLSPSTTEALELPSALGSAEVVTSGLGAKVIARTHAKRAEVYVPYRLNIHALPGLGLWLEIGTNRDPWSGCFLGVYGESEHGSVEPDAHGVGHAGVLPQQSTLHYPVQGMKIELHNKTYTAWGVHNELTPADSYFVRLNALPESLLFGAFPSDDDPDVFALSLC